jgi:phosphatidylserine/phosphatidylglycerophosphate/cardiolipin synthase-like enzyme
VITAPEPYGAELAYRMRCRTTLGVLIQLLAHAQQTVIIAAPFFQAGHGISEGPLADALRQALRRGVNVDILSTGQSLEALDRTHLIDGARGRLRLFRPHANVLDAERLGSHAKFCLADGRAAYVGSANLTSPGLYAQFEMGLLVQGSTSRQISHFWAYCIEAGLFVTV